ncbi:MAG: dual specificity protein phosphatase family protein [Acidobacteriota bacterium]
MLPRLFVGSHPACAEDIDRLAAEIGITAVLNVQTDDDLHYYGLTWPPLAAYYARRRIEARRAPVRDFDAADLRARLAGCVLALDELLAAGHKVFLHCTAGAARSPAVAIAWLVWRQRWPLEEAVTYVTQRRHCSPNVEAIRQALADRPVL